MATAQDSSGQGKPSVAEVDQTSSGVTPVNPAWLQTNLPCRAACPVGTHAGGYVSLIASGQHEAAYMLARRPNPFASVCGRICAHPCEAACRRQHVDAPVSIRALKRFVTEQFGVESSRSFDAVKEAVERPRPTADKPGKVAVVGAGPAGLSCAHDLKLMGHEVVVLDGAPVAGGMMRLGIPAYRLPRELIQQEVDFIEWLGVEIRLGVEVGRDVTMEQLTADYDAVFLAPGCRKGRGLKLPGMEHDGVLTAVDFLAAVNLERPIEVGERVVVVGGGNVAFDVARTARRFGGTSEPDEPHHNLMLDAARTAARELGKQVTLIALEAAHEMPADHEEIEEGGREGIKLLHRKAPMAVLGQDGKVRALQVQDVARVFDDQGRFSPQMEPDTDAELVCDTIIFAVGQVADLEFLGQDHRLQLNPNNTIAVDRQTLATSLAGVYAGGDVAFGPRIVIEAVSDGRRAALAIDSQLTGRADAEPELALRVFDAYGYEHPFAVGDYERLHRADPATIAVDLRSQEAQVELRYDEQQACIEGARCLHCWINTIFDSRAMSGSECIQCGGCVDVCPEECIDLIGLLRIGQGADDGQLRLADGSPLELAGAPGAALIKDETVCIRCGLCARRCPVGCITMQGFYNKHELDLLRRCEGSL